MKRSTVRTGIGYDSHRFEPGDHIILGGVQIPASVRLVAHSDGDAVCHAVTDALLGAAGEGDIGAMFPDSDAVNKGRNSIEMLTLAVSRVRQHGWTVCNVDVTVIAEQPRISGHSRQMKQSLGAALGVDGSCVNVKGKSNEGMGWIGRGEGLACIAVATIERAGD